MQNILGYSPLQAGIRFLPATLMIVAIAPIAGRLDRPDRPADPDRGRALAGLRVDVLAHQIDPSRPTATCLPSFILMGVGMALVMSPMSTAAMNAVADAKAGIASGILSMNRMIGGTLGVAVIGAVFQARLGGLGFNGRPEPDGAAAQARATASVERSQSPAARPRSAAVARRRSP